MNNQSLKLKENVSGYLLMMLHQVCIIAVFS